MSNTVLPCYIVVHHLQFCRLFSVLFLVHCVLHPDELLSISINLLRAVSQVQNSVCFPQNFNRNLVFVFYSIILDLFFYDCLSFESLNKRGKCENINVCLNKVYKRCCEKFDNLKTFVILLYGFHLSQVIYGP